MPMPFRIIVSVLKLVMQSMLYQQDGSRGAPAGDQIVASFGLPRLRA